MKLHYPISNLLLKPQFLKENFIPSFCINYQCLICKNLHMYISAQTNKAFIWSFSEIFKKRRFS